MGFPKPLLQVGLETYIARLIHAMLETVDSLIVVLGAHRERVRLVVPDDRRIEVVVNPDFSRGQLSSLKAALSQVNGEAQAVMVHLIDHPTVLPSTFRGLVDNWRTRSHPIVIARCRGRRGHPVVFDRGLFHELMATPDDNGARDVVNADAGRVYYFDVDDPGVTLDLDTPADVARAGLTPPRSSDGD